MRDKGQIAKKIGYGEQVVIQGIERVSEGLERLGITQKKI